jgi:DNA-binding NtrC family response regulator
MAHILIVDDEIGHCRMLEMVLREHGHRPRSVHSGEDALRAARADDEPDVILLDVQLGGMDGIETLRRLRASGVGVPVLVITGCGSISSAVRAMKVGATDFLTKPVETEELLALVDRVVGLHAPSSADARSLVGTSGTYRKALDLARRFAVQDISVLLIGETGTGKELFARSIHGASRRAHGPFVPVDCSTLAESLIESELFGHEKGSFTGAIAARVGRFELAQRGTLFLDEIGNLPLPIQAKLLRVLQARQLERVGGREAIPLDVRVVAATNVNLLDAIAAGRFRQDLYFRLQEVTIELPPLRERDGDVRGLAEHFVRLYARRFDLPIEGIAEATYAILERYDWPGNVRELENAMKSSVVLASDWVLPEHLPPPILARVGADATLREAVAANGDGEKLCFELEVGLRGSAVDLKALGARAAEQAERSVLQALIRRSRSSAHLAKVLSVDPKTLRLKLRRYGLVSPLDGRRPGLEHELAGGPTRSPTR